MGVPINNVTRRVVYAASGTGPYNFTFEILAAADIAVYRDDTLLTITTDYTVTINANGTGFVTLVATPTGATQIAIVGNRTISRTSDFVTGGDFFANTLNDELDQQTIFNQQNAEGLGRALLAPQTDPTTIDMTLPRAADRANKTLAFDANGDPTLGISAADVANAVTYATNAANSATAAASSASSASSSASSASSSASTATTQAGNASTSATNAASSASAASTSASNAATSATNAANSASTATTQATNASNSASSASTSASNASTSASNAASAQSAAEAARDQTLASFDSFDDRYLGAKTSDPTLDNDGNALVAGALYFNSTSGIMKVYTGSVWVAAYVSGTDFLAKANNLSDLNNTATARTNLGLGTGDSPQFTALNVGNASDTTVTRASAGVIAVEGNNVLTANNIGTSVQAYSAELQGASQGGINGMKNRIINGAMVIDQRNAGASVTPTGSGGYTLDRWTFSISQASKFSTQQSTVAPAGFINSMLITSLSAYSIVSGDYFLLNQRIEGLNVTDFGWGTANAQAVTLSFQVRSSLTGTFGGAITNSAGNRSYPFTYTISAANTWETKSVTIPGDTTGTWLTTNGVGVNLRFGLGVGSTYSAAAGAWTAGEYFSATGATSVVGTNGATFYITGVQLEKGSTATSFDYRPYGTELALCERYLPAFSGSADFFAGQAVATNQASISVPFQTTTRVAPTGISVTGATSSTVYNSTGGGITTTGITFVTAGTKSAFLTATVASGLSAGNATGLILNSASTKILFNGCEL